MAGESVVVAMSGGVDSSVAAQLLVEAGHDVVGVFMRTGRHGDAPSRGCCSVTDSRDAGRVADRLGIPLYRVDFEAEFQGIVDYYVGEYRTGRTPNPCILCNRDLKFGRLFDYAAAAGADRVATGHYATVVENGDRLAIRRGADPAKDQSYVLFPLVQEQLRRTTLPLGNMTKAEVRGIAEKAGLAVFDKRESQEICFVPDGGQREFMAALGTLTPGPFLDSAGREMGWHSGYEQFTVGQRRGLGMAFGEPRYVTCILPERAAVVLGGQEDLLATEHTVSDWVGSGRPVPAPGETLSAHVQLRYRHKAAEATLTGLGANRVRVVFREPQSAITPGQAAVAYQRDFVVGGGWIEGRNQTPLR